MKFKIPAHSRVSILTIVPLSFFLQILSSCATVPDHRVSTDKPRSNPTDLTSSPPSRPLTVVNLESEIKEESMALDPQSKPAVISLEINDGVEKWLEYFTGNGRERFETYMIRGARYRNLIETTLAKYDVPVEMYYLAMIESGFSIKARSIVGAQGVWQFMKPTAQRYQLLVNYEVDERMDVVRATEAAAKYLRDLHNVFQSWHLAMAAYNAGESRIMGAIMRSATRDFWTLAERRALPRETMNYVPKFIAASLIGHNPRKYGFKVPSNESDNLDLASIAVPHGRSLRTIADVSGVSVQALIDRNPHLRTGVLPQVSSGQYLLHAPQAAVSRIQGSLEAIAETPLQRVSSKMVATKSNSKTHRVRAGENLNLIARNYATSVQNLMQINGLSKSSIYVGQNLIVSTNASSTKGKSISKDIASHKNYKVKKGDNLNDLARKFQTEVARIMKLNNLKKSSLQVGQVIKIPSRG